MDENEENQTRKFYSLTEIFSKVGGVLHVIKLISSLIFCQYSKQCYNVDAINNLIKIENDKQTETEDQDQPIEISSVQKLLLASYFCVNKKLRKKYQKYKKIVYQKHDLVKIIRDIDDLNEKLKSLTNIKSLSSSYLSNTEVYPPPNISKRIEIIEHSESDIHNFGIISKNQEKDVQMQIDSVHPSSKKKNLDPNFLNFNENPKILDKEMCELSMLSNDRVILEMNQTNFNLIKT